MIALGSHGASRALPFALLASLAFSEDTYTYRSTFVVINCDSPASFHLDRIAYRHCICVLDADHVSCFTHQLALRILSPKMRLTAASVVLADGVGGVDLLLVFSVPL